jgi:hypothetical protein
VNLHGTELLLPTKFSRLKHPVPGSSAGVWLHIILIIAQARDEEQQMASDKRYKIRAHYKFFYFILLDVND